MNIFEAKDVVLYYYSTNHIFKNRIKTQQFLLAEKIVEEYEQRLLNPPPPPKEKELVTMKDMQEIVNAGLSEQYRVMYVTPYPNSQRRRYYISNGKKMLFIGETLEQCLTTYLRRRAYIIEFFKKI